MIAFKNSERKTLKNWLVETVGVCFDIQNAISRKLDMSIFENTTIDGIVHWGFYFKWKYLENILHQTF